MIFNFISSVLTKIYNFAQSVFQWLFGDINFSVLWDWLPQDIQNAAAFFVVLLFCLMLFRLIKSILPF